MDSGHGVVLIGEAAKWWVALEWVKFLFMVGVLGGVVWLIFLFVRYAERERKKAEEEGRD